MKTLYIISFILSQLDSYGQLIQNTVSYRNVSADKYIRFHYENDYFSETDKYYTQGMQLEFVHPRIRKFPLSKLVFTTTNKQIKYGLSLEHLGFTPSSITNTSIILNERPFAATLFLKTFSIINDSVNNYRVNSILSTGVIGPLAGGNEIQSEIHTWLGNVQPEGWKYQIQNDFVINYQVDIEKQLLRIKSYLLLNAKAGAMVGTLFDKAYVSTILMAGLFDNPFTAFNTSHKKYQVYLYSEPMLQAIGYDATLQGGVFNRKSVHTIPNKDIERLLFQHNFGIVVKLQRWNLEYFQSFITTTYAGQGSHRWGGIRIGYVFN